MKGTVDIFESFVQACKAGRIAVAEQAFTAEISRIKETSKGLICPVSGDVGRRFETIMEGVQERLCPDAKASSFSAGYMGRFSPRISYASKQLQTRDDFMRVRFHEGIHAAQARSNTFHFLADPMAPLVCEPFSCLRLGLIFEMEAIMKAEWLLYLASPEAAGADLIGTRADLADFLYHNGSNIMDSESSIFSLYEDDIFTAYAVLLGQRIDNGYPVRRYYRLTDEDLQVCGNIGILPNLWGIHNKPQIPDFAWSDDILGRICKFSEMAGIPDENEVPTLTEALAEEGFSLAEINRRVLAGERLSAIWGDRAVQQGPVDPEAEPYPAHRPN